MACPPDASISTDFVSGPPVRSDADRLLRHHPVFGAVPARDREALLGLGRLHHVPDGGLVYQRGDRCRGSYLVLQGIVEIYRTTPDGRRLVLHVARPGTIFALEPLGDSAVRTHGATADVVEEAALWCLPTEATAALVAERPILNQALLQCMARAAQELADRLENLALYSVQERLARYLLDEADGGGAFTLDIRKSTLAAYLGTVPETLSRSLHALTDDGLICQEGAQIVLLDADGLRDLAGRSHGA